MKEEEVSKQFENLISTIIIFNLKIYTKNFVQPCRWTVTFNLYYTVWKNLGHLGNLWHNRILL